MPVDGTLIFDTEIDRSGIQKGSNLVKADLEKLGTQAKDIFSSGNLASGLTALGGKLVGAFAFAKLAEGLKNAAVAAVKYNAQMEAYQTNFSVMLGDEAKGVEYVAQLREKAAKTPFGMEDLASAAQTMLSFGLDAENTNTAMDRLGDIALGNKEKFQSLSLAFSQISAAGKLTGQDLLQMVNAGFNPLNTLAEKTGTSLGDLKDVMSGGKGSAAFRKQMKDAQNEVKKLGAGASEGAKLLAQIGQEGMISAEMVGKAMEIETSPGGRFYNGMENASKTMQGQFSTLKDNSMQLIGNIFSPLSDALSGVVLPAANGVIDALNGLFEDRSFKVEAEAEIDAAMDNLNSLDEKVKDLKEQYARDQISLKVKIENAEDLAGQIEGMFAVKPRLKEWDDTEKQEAIGILEQLNDMMPGFKYTPDENGLKKLQEDLKAEAGSVSALVEEYRKLEELRNMSRLVEGMRAAETDAQANLIYLNQQRDALLQDKNNRLNRRDAFSYLFGETTDSINSFSGKLSPSEKDGGIGNLTHEDLVNGLDLLNAFQQLAPLTDLEKVDPNIDLSKLTGLTGELLTAEEMAGNTEAIQAMIQAIYALQELSFEQSEAEDAAANAMDTKIAEMDTSIAQAETTLAELKAEREAYEGIVERLNAGETIDEINQSFSEKPVTIPIEAQDNASEGIDDVKQKCENLDGKTYTVTLLLNQERSETDGSHAAGLDFVPFDGYIAQLHRGEAVLTRTEAQLWRAGKSAAQESGGMLGDAGGSFQQVNNFNVPVQTPDEFAKTMRLYATYGLEGVI
ncbi:MAG: tape measure protein [Candidatus Limiplasma sp.]|nr:tape measure protein [Candidatus Limiplasma sp.]